MPTIIQRNEKFKGKKAFDRWRASLWDEIDRRRPPRPQMSPEWLAQNNQKNRASHDRTDA